MFVLCMVLWGVVIIQGSEMEDDISCVYVDNTGVSGACDAPIP